MSNSALTDNSLIRYAVCRLPPRIKRLIYVSSLASTVNGTLNKNQYDVINKKMSLASTGCSSMMFPALFSKYIWKNKDLINSQLLELKYNDNDIIYSKRIKRIIELTPDWIKYDSENKIYKDINTLFSRKENLLF